MKRLFVAICLVLLATSSAFGIGQRAPEKIGEEINLARPMESRGEPRVVDAERNASEETLVWSEELWFGGADYIAPHFSKFDLPEGARVVVRNQDGSRSWTYTGKGKDLDQPELGFWAIHIYGESAIVELFSSVPVRRGAVVIDRFARGFKPDEILRSEPEALCGADDSQWAKCYQSSEPTVYDRSRTVARLMIGGTGACTGWLVGSEGHVMTNEHCITSASDAQNTTYELMAEGATCSTNCASWGACPGTVVASTSTLVKNNASLDYALVKLPSNPTSTYGYLQMRSSGASLGERIYIPQHPQAYGKKIALKAGSADATVISVNETPCSGGPGDIGYAADTQGGSSGSPVLGYSDHTVVALHHCGPCSPGNRGVPIDAVIANLGSLAPANSVAGGEPPPPPGDDVITLTVSKQVRGKKYTARLRWNGSTAAGVDVMRNGAKITTTSNDGAYDENVARGTYTYQVCNAGTTVCSNSVAISF